MERVATLIKSSRIFSSLRDKAIKEIASKCLKIRLFKGDVLFHQGDPSDAIYLLLEGKLKAHLTLTKGSNKLVGYVTQGEMVGELGALAKEPRSLTLTVLKDATLLKWSIKDFLMICHRYPSLMFQIITPIITRSRSTLQLLTAAKRNKNIVIIAANRKVHLEKFVAKFIRTTAKYHQLLVVSEYAKPPKQMKKNPRKIIYILKSCQSALAKRALESGDAFYIAAQSEGKAKISPAIFQAIKKQGVHYFSNIKLILIHPAKTTIPKNTAAWLAAGDFALHHHVRMDELQDFQRLLRFIRERAIALVLSGGGTRGWAHLGVMKALIEARVPIDIIGGTSAGAIVAGCYVMHQNFNDLYERFKQLVLKSHHSVAIRSLTWPAISLFNAKRFTQAQQEAFGDQQIEDLWIPYFCVSCNLSKNDESIHHTGFLWEKTRASASIPGLLPPMVIQGELHFDGGLFNNLPVDAMRDLIGYRNKIIAVDLNTLDKHHHKYKFPPILTWQDILLSKFKRRGYHYKFPRFVDTFLRSLFAGSVAKSRQNGLAANLLITLNLNDFRMLYVNLQEAQKLIDFGYKEARKQIQLYFKK